MAVAHDIGALGETLALRFLLDRGLSLVERNVFVDGDELDLVVRNGAEIVVVEVKTSKNGDDPIEAVDDVKASRVTRAVNAYRLPVDRIDVIGVMLTNRGAAIRWLRGAI